jgi:hypothetical protein
MRQHVEMLHDRRQRYWELPPKLANGQDRLVAELRQYCPSRRVGQGGKDAVKSAVVILNHQV